MKCISKTHVGDMQRERTVYRDGKTCKVNSSQMDRERRVCIWVSCYKINKDNRVREDK
jgi:hypothetical protein